MIRYSYIQHKVLEIYLKLPAIQFPLDPKQIVKLFPNCRYMSYQRFSELNDCSLEEVVQLCESKSGCTHYDSEKNRYLILCNQSEDDNNNPGRQRWTCSHEIGHIVCKHHINLAFEKSVKNGNSDIEMLAENSLVPISDSDYESEADYFAATLLAPFPILKYLGIRSPIELQDLCGLSTSASLYRFKEYLKWCSSHRKTAWENDMISAFRTKGTYSST